LVFNFEVFVVVLVYVREHMRIPFAGLVVVRL
jgi:hypothetical protein